MFSFGIVYTAGYGISDHCRENYIHVYMIVHEHVTVTDMVDIHGT